MEGEVFKGLKSKFLVTFGFSILLAITIMVIIFGLSISRYYYSEIENFMESELSISAGIYNKYFGRDSIESKADIIIENASLEQFADIQLLDKKNQLISSTGTKFDYTKNQFYDYKMNGNVIDYDTIGEDDYLVISVPLLDNHNEFVGVIRAISIINVLNKEVNGIVLNAVLFGLGIFSLSIAIGTLFANSIIDPIKKLTIASKLIADGDLTNRVYVNNTDEIGELAKTFNDMADEIKKSERLKTDFVSSISHELRTPLTAIKGWSETILYDGFSNKKESEEGINIIINETDRLSKLVEELLDFSRFQTNSMVLNKEPVDLNLLLKDVEKLLSHRSNVYKYKVEFDYDEDLKSIDCDYNRIKQVIINIIDNSLKHGGDGCNVKIYTSKSPNSYKIVFKDNGVGISENILKDIKKKFFKGKTNTSGSGLGLAIADEILKLHDGQLIISSEENLGTTVVIELPK